MTEKTTKPRTKKKKLTLKQQKFIKNYLETGNGTQSAIKAGYSKNSAREIASKNLTKVDIIEEIESAADKLGINTEYVLQSLKEIAEFNKTIRVKAKSIGGELFQEEEMIDAPAAIKSNELLGKHLKLFTEKAELDVKVETNEKPDLPKLARELAYIFSKADK